MNRLRSWGFRFSVINAVAFVAFAAVIAGLHWLGSSLWWVVAIVAGHFFLFCSVFRVIRRRELIWAALFILNVRFWLLLDRFDWFTEVARLLPVSAGVSALEGQT